jgi:eukaryotic-like serine/threonine-protein kinase
MTSEEWNRLFDLFHAAREKSGGDRVMLLDAACGESTVLRQAVDELLREDEAANGFLSVPLLNALTGERQGRIVPGQCFGRYTTMALIGRGGMGEVWSAYDTELERLVALKFLSPETLIGFDAQQITREAKVASALNHPGIVTIHEVVHSESTFAIVMELVEGKPLRELCGKLMPIPQVLAIGLEIAEAMAAAHAAGTLHGDIKPENIFLRPDKHVKVLDFGLARKVTTETIALGSSPALGTLRYMSPEQARGEPLTPASDVFSFGLVLYELLAGRHAFPATSPLDTAQGILMKEAAPPSSFNSAVPARLDSLVRAMLAKAPAARPSTTQVAEALNHLREPPKARTFFSPAWKWAIAAIVCMIAALVVWRWRQSREPNEIRSLRQITTLVPENRATAAAISPDGKLAAYANVDGVFLRTIRSGDTKTLSVPGDYVVDRLAWFADGAKLVASGFSTTTNVPSIWLISTAGAVPSLLRTHARGATPSPDGAHVAFMSQDWSAIWVIGTDGREPRKVVDGAADDTFPLVYWSPDGSRLAFQRQHFSPERQSPSYEFDRFYQRSYESVEAIHGKVTATAADIGSDLAALADGRVLFLRHIPPSAPRIDEFDELWEVKTDPTTGAFVGAPRKIATLPAEYETHMYGMSASADAKLVLLLKRSDQYAVFVGDFDEAPPRISNIRRLTLDERTCYPHAWTADSRSVIFESMRNGTWDIFRQDLTERTAKVLVATPLMEVLPHLSPDGRWVLYSAATSIEPRIYALMRVPIEGGTPEQVRMSGPFDELRCPLRGGNGCVLRTAIGHEYYAFYDFDPIRGKGRELARTRWLPNGTEDWDVSPDGTEVAIPNYDSRDARIRIVALHARSTRSGEREMTLPGLADLRHAVWSASGRGWFITVNMTVGRRMLYAYPDGSFRPLGDMLGAAVPSPDGRRVAFVNPLTATNAWLIDRY